MKIPKLSISVWLWAGAALILAAGLGWLAWPRAPVVTTVPVSRGPVQLELADEGHTRIHDVYVVAAPVSGALQRLPVEAGDAIEKGQVVATLRPAPPLPLDARSAAEADAAVAAATAAVRAAEGDVVMARRQSVRTRALFDQGYASQAAFDAATTALTVANATLSARKADLRRARIAAGLGNGETREIAQVKSPAAGHVLRLYQQSEAVIAAGTPLLDIGNPANIEVVAEFLTQDAVRMHTGDPAYVENWGGGPPIAATVTRIEPFARTKVSALGVEEQRVNVIAQLAAPRDAPRLGHGFRVDLRVLVARQDDVVRVPSDALVRDGRDWGVYTVRDHRLVFRRVRIGESSGPFRPVLSGLQPGDPIVLFPSDALRPGLTVRVTSGQAP
jgi:HlyD family secretion protein